MAMNGLSQSASDSMVPVARSSARCGARSKPLLMTSEFIKQFSTYDIQMDKFNARNVAAAGGRVTQLSALAQMEL
jgi:hypothetical protein